MTRMDHPEIEIINPSSADEYKGYSPGRDGFEQRSPRRSKQHVDDDFSRGFETLEINERRNKDKERRKSVVIEAGRIMRRRSSSGSKRPSRYYEFYQFEKRGGDWNLADRISMKAPQDELEKKVAKGKNNKSKILDKMKAMNALRRDQINRLLDEKNYAEKDKDAEWVPVSIETTRQRGTSVLAFDIVIAQSYKPAGPAPRGNRISFVGERSDLRDPIRFKGKDKDKDKGKDKDKDRSKETRGDDHDHNHNHDQDFFGEDRLFTNDGRPIENHGVPFGGQKVDRRPLPLEDPIAGPPPGMQPPRPPPGGWNDPFPPGGGFPHDAHHNQAPIEVMHDNFQPHDMQAGNGVLDLDQLLEKPNGGHGHQSFDQPRLEHFGGAAPGDFRPTGPDRQRSGERRKSGSRPRPKRISTDQGLPQYREHRRRYQWGDSSIDDEDEVVSVFFDGDDRESMSSLGDEHERFIERRGSLKRRPSGRRGEPLYREHHRRGASYYPGRRDMIVEPGRTPRRPVPERRQTIAYVEPRQITYPHRSGRDRDVIDEPLSPVLTQRSYSPGLLGRRDSRAPPPELPYPDELREKDRRAENYMDAIEREARYREEDVRRQERDLDDRDARRRSGKVMYREYRPERFYDEGRRG